VETLGGEEVQLLLILNLGTRQEWVVSVMHRQRFSPGKRTTGIHWMGGWVGPRTGLDTEVRGKSLLPLPGIELWSPGHPVCSQTLYWWNYLAPEERNYIIKFLMLQDACMTLMFYVKVQNILNFKYCICNSTSIESQIYVPVTFVTGNDLRSKILKHWHIDTGHLV
jgi:hypothetical protein